MSEERLRGLRIFDISDLDNPVDVGNVQTCRGSHTHTVLDDPNDAENVVIQVPVANPLLTQNEIDAAAIRDARQALATAEARSGSARHGALARLAAALHEQAPGARDRLKVWTLAEAVRALTGE